MFGQKRASSPSVEKNIKEYFAQEAEQVSVPPVPVWYRENRQSGSIRPIVRKIAFPCIAAGAMVLLAVSAGSTTTLSRSIDTAFVRYQVKSKVTHFILEAGSIYREELFRGEKQ